MKLTPYDWQEGIIQRMLAEPTHSVLLASEQDTGKTLVASEFLARKPEFQRVLIAGVKDTFAQWRDRLAAQSDGRIELRRVDSTKKGRAAFEALLAGENGYFFAGHQYLATQDWTRVFELDGDRRRIYALKRGKPVLKPRREGEIGPAFVPTFAMKRKHLRRYVKMRPLDVLISDESHIHANRTSNGIGTVRSIPTDWRIALSGTFYGNKFENAHTLTRWLWPAELNEAGEYIIAPSVVSWRAQWMAFGEVEFWTRAIPFGALVLESAGDRHKVRVKDYNGEKNPGEFVATLPCYLRVESPSGPVPEPELFEIDLSPAERVGYDQMVEEGVMWLDAHGDLEPLVSNLPVVKRTRLRTAALGTMSLRWLREIDKDGRQVSEVFFNEDTRSTKLQALRQILDRPDWAGKQAIVFTHSRVFAEVVAIRMQRAGYAAALWAGSVSSKERDQIKADFLAGKVRYIVAVVESFSTGLDGFQAVCNRVVWLSRSDNTTQNSQAARRIWRNGGDLENYRSVEVIARDTYDAGVFDAYRVKTSLMRRTLAAA